MDPKDAAHLSTTAEAPAHDVLNAIEEQVNEAAALPGLPLPLRTALPALVGVVRELRNGLDALREGLGE
jgi:hypothetical protein